MKKNIYLVLLAAMMLFAPSSRAQLLYKISGKDLNKASYIVGTFHLANASFAEKITGIGEAMANTEQVYGEVDFDDALNPDSTRILSSMQFLPEGQTVKSILTEEQFNKLDAFSASIFGIGIGNDLLFSQMGKMTPAAIFNTLTVMMYLKKSPDKLDPQNLIDNYFQRQAKDAGKGIGGFETISYQANVLLGSKSMERDIELLMCLVDNGDIYEEINEELVNAYYSQDIEAVEKAVNYEFANKCDATPEEKDILINNRNVNWCDMMPAVMKEKSTLFVVGAGHLPGERGVLQLLRNAGYTVEGVK